MLEVGWAPAGAGRLVGPLGPIPALLTTTSPGGPVPAVHHAGALICLPHTLSASSKAGLFGFTPAALKLLSPLGPGLG